MPDTVNSQLTAAIAQGQQSVIEPSADVARAMFQQAQVQAFALAMQNAVAAQQQHQILDQALVAAATARILARRSR